MSDAAGSPLTTGTRIGNYRVDRLLGRGGMGAVYLAYDTVLHRQVALKVLAEATESEVSRARLVREARSAAGLNHPNICTVYEVGEAGAGEVGGIAFIVMEYVEGVTLHDRLAAGPLAMDEAIRCSIQAADALAHAHERGVIHRDLKAANVILTDRGRIKIVDFGLARRGGSPAAGDRTTEGTMGADATVTATVVPIGSLAGTPYAMAPEQVRGQAADARTDIWALGVLMYEMVGGAKPFTETVPAELFSAILRDPPAPLPDSVPAELQAVIGRCLEKSPERRYQRASEVHSSLEAIQSGAAPLPSPSRPGREAQAVEPRRAERFSLSRRGGLIAAAVVVAAVVAGLYLAHVRTRFTTNPLETAPVTVAVLPLVNQTGDPAQEYLSDGLTEEITTSLGRLNAQGLTVIAPTSAMRYKGSAEPLAQIGRELDAGAILRGTLVRAGDRVKLEAELVQASSGHTLWRESYDRSASELFTLERDVSGAVARALGLPTAARERAGSAGAAKASRNPDAYDLYLRGLSHLKLENESNLDQAIALLERSAALDPTFVPAQAYLAMACGEKSAMFRPNEPQWEEEGFAAARKALDLDPDAPEAHYAQAMMMWRPSHGFPSREALAELRLALAAEPNFDEAWHQHGVILFHVGHLDGALADIQRALQINPDNTVARFRLGPIYVYQQKFEEAIAALDQLPSDVYPAQWTYQKAWALLSLGRLDEAGHLLDAALKDNPVDQGGVLHAARAMLRAKRGDRRGAEADIEEAVQVGKSFIHFHHTAYSIGATYAALGDLEKAEEWVEKAANDGFPNYAFFEADVNLAPLRVTPRFRALIEKLRAEWEHIPGEPD